MEKEDHGLSSFIISLNDGVYELLSTNAHHCSGMTLTLTALNKACMNEWKSLFNVGLSFYMGNQRKMSLKIKKKMDSKGKSIGLNENKKKRNEDGPWLDGHLPKEEITGHGGHFEFYRASMSINETMAVQASLNQKGKFRAKLENEMITVAWRRENPIFMDINDFTKINVTRYYSVRNDKKKVLKVLKKKRWSYVIPRLNLLSDIIDDSDRREREITEKFKDRSSEVVDWPSIYDITEYFLIFEHVSTIIDFLEVKKNENECTVDTKHSLHQQQLKNSQAFNINLVRINIEGRTALTGINTNSVKNDLL
ncbi:hypothetical protein U3516DRAFT_768317 [Neocallimastix sp. 'constans']